jgi:hypothetical protein
LILLFSVKEQIEKKTWVWKVKKQNMVVHIYNPNIWEAEEKGW